MPKTKSNTVTKQSSFRARKKAILDWEDSRPVAEPKPKDSTTIPIQILKRRPSWNILMQRSTINSAR